MGDQGLRKRTKTAEATNDPSESDTYEQIISDEDESTSIGITILDIIRVVLGVLLVNSLLSYYVTSDSIFWNYRPRWTRPAHIKAYFKGPVELTDTELLAYDGSNPSLPIYLAINGTIFDVSSSPSHYGPGGSYNFFAGHDATRAYVTGCFDTDITWDIRGVEAMYMPIGDAADEASLTKADKKMRREKEVREARKMVDGAIKHWEGFFKEGKGGEYFAVGTILRSEGWKERTPVREVCEKALRARPKRNKES
ncbi:MAG: hypothetical protein M1814_004636 [Vezdaea aestivalis]|nr:MAG: hypothetical protein M1814_004636 [Vezdaea aestivalis]